MKRSLDELDATLRKAELALVAARRRVEKLESELAHHPDALARKLRHALPPFLHSIFLEGDGIPDHGRLLDITMSYAGASNPHNEGDMRLTLKFEKDVWTYYRNDCGSSHALAEPNRPQFIELATWNDAMADNDKNPCLALAVLATLALDWLGDMTTDETIGDAYYVGIVRQALLKGEAPSKTGLQRVFNAFGIKDDDGADVIVTDAIIELLRARRTLPRTYYELAAMESVKKKARKH